MTEYIGLVLGKLEVLKMTSILSFKILYLAKLTLLGFAMFTLATVAGLPVHDIWFDYVLFIVISAIVAGEPEPDSELTGRKFVYTWFYRSTHLLVGSATAYFLHHKSWSVIDEGKAK